MKYRTADLVLGVATLCLTGLFFLPLSIFIHNQAEFLSLRADMMRLLLFASGGVFLMTAAVLLALGPGARRLLVPALAFLSLAVWIQAYIFNWDYGVFDGSSLVFPLRDLRSADVLMWLLLAVSALFLGVIKQRSLRALFIVLLFVQAGGLLAALNTDPPPEVESAPENDGGFAGRSNEFTFSRDTNIIMLVLDGYQTDAFYEFLDAHPEFASKLPGFTYYPDALAPSYFSARCVPVLFTGQTFYGQRSHSDFMTEAYRRHSIPALLSEAGYYVGVYNYFSLADRYFHPNLLRGLADNYGEEGPVDPHHGLEVRRVLATALFRATPHLAKETVYTRWLLEAPLEQDRDVFMHGMQHYARVGDGRPRFNYYHLQGLHQPHVIDGEVLDWEDRDSVRRVAALLGEVMEVFVSRLQRLGIYDDAAIFIVADHGLLWESDQMYYGPYATPDMHKTPPLDVFAKKPRALPLVLFKPPGARGALDISDKPVSLKDIVPTVLDVAGIDGGEDYEGQSLLQLTDAPRIRRFFSSEYRRRSAGPLYEYAVSGFSWHDRSWNFTGNMHHRGRITREPLENYVPGLALSFGGAGNGNQYLDGAWQAEDDAHVMTAAKADISLPLETPLNDPVLRLEVSLPDESEEERSIQVRVNNTVLGPYTIDGRTELSMPVSLEGLTFDQTTPPARDRRAWLVTPPHTSDTRLNIQMDLGGRHARGLQLHSLTLSETQ